MSSGSSEPTVQTEGTESRGEAEQAKIRQEWTESQIIERVSGIIPAKLIPSYLELLLGDINSKLTPQQRGTMLHTFGETLLVVSANVYMLAYELSRLEHKSTFKRFFEKFTKPKPLLYRSQMFSASASLRRYNGLEVFKQLPNGSKALVFNQMQKCFADQTHTLMSMILKTGMNITEMFSPNRDRFESFYQHVLEVAEDSPNRHNLHLDTPSEEFARIARGEKMDGHLAGTSPAEILLMHFGTICAPLLILFRVYYGEEIVLQVIDRLSEFEQGITSNVVMDVLDDWDELQNYPIDWIMETRS